MAKTRRNADRLLGIDIGGSGIKGALVNPASGELVSERCRLDTPQPSSPDAVAEVVCKIVRSFDYDGTVGCTFPAIVKNGVTHSAANVDKSWIGTDADALLTRATGCSVHLLNDADAAGRAEVMFGAGSGVPGVIIVLTFGTGIGSSLFLDGKLVPNTELGHVFLKHGQEAEDWVSDRVRKSEDLHWQEWGKRLARYLAHLEFILSPDLIILGGGASKKSDRFIDYLTLDTPVVPATLRNEAGIVGAAMEAARYGR